MSETFGHGHLRFSWNKLFLSCKEEYLLPPSGFYIAPPPVQSWPNFLTFLPRDVLPLPASELAWHKSLCLKCPTCQCKCPRVNTEHYAGSAGALWLSSLFQPCILWARRVFSFLQVSGGSNPCYSVLHDCIPGFVWGGKMLPRSNAREVGRSAAAKLWNESTTG